MTKEEAIAKVVKIRNRARGTSSPAEADTARKLAEELRAKWNLTEDDLQSSSKVLAFDEMLSSLSDLATRKELPAPVAEAITMLSKNMTGAEKAAAIEKIVTAIRFGSLFLGKDRMGPVKDVVEAVLRKHDVTFM
jgi:hypothetical protein